MRMQASRWIAALCAGAAALAAPMMAGAQPHEGRVPPGQAKKQDRPERPERPERPAGGPRQSAVELRPGAVFTDAHRDAVRGYYGQQYARNCPPGLARKNNGCMPPGQAKKYGVGDRLPPNVILYPLPQGVIVQLPPVPVGYRYVRVGEDILLLSPRTSVVVDVIHAVLR